MFGLVKKTETIDITPSWEGLLPYMLAIYVDGSEESREQIASNFKRMAVAADIGVHYIKQQEKQNKTGGGINERPGSFANFNKYHNCN